MNRSLPALTALLTLTTLTSVAGCRRETSPTVTPEQNEGKGKSTAEGDVPPEGCSSAADCASRAVGFLDAGAFDKSLPLFDYACHHGFADSCYSLGVLLRSGEVAEDPVMAHGAATEGCELGHQGACVHLGLDLLLGTGGAPQDPAQATERFSNACAQGQPIGCRFLGTVHYTGQVPDADPQIAADSFEQGCALDDGASCFNRGVLLFEAEGDAQDLDGAKTFMTRACELGYKDACQAIPLVDEAIADRDAKVPGANLRVGSASVDGLTVNDLQCRVQGGAGMLGSLAVISALSKRKAKIDRCGPAGTVAEIHWVAAGGKISSADGEGEVGACVAKVLQKLTIPFDGECAAGVVLGPGS
ncbi:MAG: sel1 repeat family protein [Myxococcales bacterium]|nr:sel1 repeat family protein [Myxococcales bacterium]